MLNKIKTEMIFIKTESFGCFWDTWGGVKGPPGTFLGGGNPLYQLYVTISVIVDALKSGITKKIH